MLRGHVLELLLQRGDDESSAAQLVVSLLQPAADDADDVKATPRSSLATPRASLEASPRHSLV